MTARGHGTGFLSLELTTRCNSPCRHCFARAGRGDDASLSLELAAAACEEGYAAGYRHLHLTGGEPLLWPHLFTLLDRVRRLGYRSVFVNTNGLRLATAAGRLARYPFLSLSVSLQGPEALHDGVRGQGTYRKAAEGIRQALGKGVPTSIFVVVGKALLARLPFFAAEVNDRFGGIERLTLIQLIGVADTPPDLDEDRLDPAAFVRLVRTVSALNLYGLRTHVLNNPLVNAAADLLQVPLVPRSAPLCRPGKLMIRADGDLAPAHSSPQRFGRYAPGRLAALLHSARYETAFAPDRIVCPRCRFHATCRRHAIRHPTDEAVDPPAAEPYCRRVLALCGAQG